MFNQNVSRIESFPVTLMDKVCVRKNGLDDSLFMTATILLYNRVENLKLTYTIETPQNIESISLNPEVYSFHWFENISANPDELLKPIRNNFQSIEKLPTHEKFLSEKLNQPIFIRLMPHENTVCIFTTKVDLVVWHCAQFFIPKYFRIFKEKPITKEETSFLETLTFRMSGNYVTKLTELTYTDSFRQYVLKDQLISFEKKLFAKKVEAAKRNLQNFEMEMEAAMTKYRKACEQRIEALALVSGLKSMEDGIQEHTELQDYLMNNQRIANVSLNGSNISFVVKTYLAPHHIEEWETISSRRQVFSSYTTNKVPDPDDVKLLLDAILSENRSLKLRMCAYFSMDYFGSEVTSSKRYNFGLKDYIPNPHLNYHNCFGQNKLAILEQLKDGDAVGAIECAVACAQRVNIHESMTFNPFVKELLDFKGKCLVADDGTELSPMEAIDYLKEHNHA